MAGIIGGATSGVAKDVRLHSVRVFPCSGGSPYSTIIDAVNWVRANHLKPAVATRSLSGGANLALDEAVSGSIAAGVVYAVAAGNWNGDACRSSPGRLPEALTVGATDANDYRAPFSNYGPCVDLFAPGTSITSAGYISDTAFMVRSGTSMAAPHAAGSAALFLGFNPTATADMVTQALIGSAPRGRGLNPGPGSPNRMLFSSPYIQHRSAFVARHSGQCLDVWGASQDPGGRWFSGSATPTTASSSRSSTGARAASASGRGTAASAWRSREPARRPGPPSSRTPATVGPTSSSSSEPSVWRPWRRPAVSGACQGWNAARRRVTQSGLNPHAPPRRVPGGLPMDAQRTLLPVEAVLLGTASGR